MRKILIPFDSNRAFSKTMIYHIIYYFGKIELNEARAIMEAMRRQEDVYIDISTDNWPNLEQMFKKEGIAYHLIG